MKPIYVFLIALGTGILGFLAGGGFGLVGSGVAGSVLGYVTGMCSVVDTAVSQGIITQTKAEQLGTTIGERIHQKNPDLKVTTNQDQNLTINSSSPVCNKFLTNVKQGLETSK